jgi:hypothetical protein
VSRNDKTRDGIIDNPVSAGPFIRIPCAERIFRDSLHENSPIRLAEKAECTHASIAIGLLIILSPIFIPAAVTAVGAITNARQPRRERIANPLGDGVGPIGGQSISHEHPRQAAVL